MTTTQVSLNVPVSIVLRNTAEMEIVRKTFEKMELKLNLEKVAMLPSRLYCVVYLEKDDEYKEVKKRLLKHVSVVG